MGAAAKPAEPVLERALAQASPDSRLHDALDRALRSVRGEPVEPEAAPGGELLAGLSKRTVVEFVEQPLDEYLRYLVLEGALPISGPPWPFSRETCVTYRAGGVSVERVLRCCLLMNDADCEFRGREILVFDPDAKP